jgi:hypothetical protein
MSVKILSEKASRRVQRSGLTKAWSTKCVGRDGFHSVPDFSLWRWRARTAETGSLTISDFASGVSVGEDVEEKSGTRWNASLPVCCGHWAGHRFTFPSSVLEIVRYP